MPRNREPVCWWCDLPASTRKVLVADEAHDCWWHRPCLKAKKREDRKYAQKAAAYKSPKRKLKAPTNKPKPKAKRIKTRRRSAA